MFIADPIVFVDLPKTGSSHVRRILADVLGGRDLGVHVRPGRKLRRRYTEFWGTVRDPWDWYVSLWAYGCSGRGTLFQALTTDLGWLRSRGWKHDPLAALGALRHSPRRRRQAWLSTYADVSDPENFRRWLRMLHDPAHCADPGDAYAASGLAGFAGLLTWRYLRLYCSRAPRGLTGQDELDRFEATHRYITRFLRTDRLADDLVEAFAAAGRPLTAAQKGAIARSGRTNRSDRHRDPAHYYDAETARLVGERDRLIAERFGFTPPIS